MNILIMRKKWLIVNERIRISILKRIREQQWPSIAPRINELK